MTQSKACPVTFSPHPVTSPTLTFSERRLRMQDLAHHHHHQQQKRPDTALRREDNTAEYPLDRWSAEADIPQEHEAENEEEEEEEEQDDTGNEADEEEGDTGNEDDDLSLQASHLPYPDLNFQQRRRRLQELAENRARQRVTQQHQHQHQQREKRRRGQQHRQKLQRLQERRERRRQWRVMKDEFILEWRDTFGYDERPPDMEQQFGGGRRGRLPGRYETWWLVPARTSRTMLERA